MLNILYKALLEIGGVRETAHICIFGQRELYNVYQCGNLLSQQFDFKKTILRKYRDVCKDVCTKIFTLPYI